MAAVSLASVCARQRILFDGAGQIVLIAMDSDDLKALLSNDFEVEASVLQAFYPGNVGGGADRVRHS